MGILLTALVAALIGAVVGLILSLFPATRGYATVAGVIVAIVVFLVRINAL